jgi:hypothetical protein
VQAFDNTRKAACCIPSKLQFVGFEAVPQSIREREDAYPIAQDYADLLGREASPFLTCKNRAPVGRAQIS